MPRRNLRLASLVPVALAVLALAGCGTNEGRTTSYRLNPTPDVDTLSQSHEEIENAVTISYDYNFRQLNSDLGRVFMTDRPSRLSPREINW
jgi:hypothetical protein